MSNDEYQHQSTWLDKLKHEYKEMAKEEIIAGPVCVQEDENGKCLMSVSYVMLDLSSTKTFCEQLKEQNQHDKTT